jgi:radical SAM superfamily enzyme YgiQ (UPF0313 family)
VDKIVAELLELSRKYQTTSFQFADAAVNGNPRLLSDLCDRLISEFPDIQWYSYAKIKGFSPELLRKVRNAGCFALFWGVESAYQPTVDLLGKSFKSADIRRVIDEASDLGIKSYVHVMYNTPHESPEEVKVFIELVKRYIDSDAVTFLPQRFLLEPQSLMFEHPERYGLVSVRKVNTGLFEREQFTFEEAHGADYPEVRARNERHYQALSYYLDLIRFRNMLGTLRNGFVRRWLPRLLVHTGKFSGESRLIDLIHRALVRWTGSDRPGFREQL